MSASLGYVLERWWFRDALHRQIPICLKPTARDGIEENLPFIPLSTRNTLHECMGKLVTF